MSRQNFSSVVDREGVVRFRRTSTLSPSAVTVMNNVVSFPPRPDSHADYQGHDSSLAELEAENVALRNSAIELVLKIQDLCDRKRRSNPSSRY
jgi:hypothetical protein